MLGIPSADVPFVMLVVVPVSTLVPVVFLIIFAMAVAVTMILVLRKRGSAGEEENSQQCGKYPFRGFQTFLLKKAE